MYSILIIPYTPRQETKRGTDFSSCARDHIKETKKDPRCAKSDEIHYLFSAPVYTHGNKWIYISRNNIIRKHQLILFHFTVSQHLPPYCNNQSHSAVLQKIMQQRICKLVFCLVAVQWSRSHLSASYKDLGKFTSLLKVYKKFDSSNNLIVETQFAISILKVQIFIIVW